MDAPDFDALTKRIVGADYQTWTHALDTVRQELVNVWNARGVADAAAIDQQLATHGGWMATEPWRNKIREAIKGLDR